MENVEQALAQAMQLHRSNDLHGAERIYRGILDQAPDQPEALHYLGLIALQVGRAEEAIGLIEQAVEQRPGDIDALANLGNALSSMQRFEDAAERFRQVLDVAPDSAATLANLGATLIKLGRNKDAVEALERALRLQPDLHGARRSLIAALRNLQWTREALDEIRKLIANQRLTPELEAYFAEALAEDGQLDEAISRYEALVAAYPNVTNARYNLATLYTRAARFDDAVREYDRVIEDTPDNVIAIFNLGSVYVSLGDKPAALAQYRKALEIDPGYAKAWHGIAFLDKAEISEDDERHIIELQNDPETSDEDGAYLAFALARYYDRHSRIDDASAQYLSGNSLYRQTLEIDIDKRIGEFEHICRIFDEGFFRTWDDIGLDDQTPIFVMGMPRSGTSLVEQVLASHSEVYGAGEMSLLFNSIRNNFRFYDAHDYGDAISVATKDQFRSTAEQYLDRLPKGDFTRVVSKMPLDFMHIGMVRVMFPNATIIHCRRDARDNCFSIFTNIFVATGHSYAYDLEEIARFYRAYQGVMEHWENVLPGFVHTVEYKDMVENQEATTRAIVDACGLDWQPACLEFHATERPVPTLSAFQVRQPIYRSSIGSWKPYERMLQPMLELL
jgi:tetratricopeptide (TPR) repeat protein